MIQKPKICKEIDPFMKKWVVENNSMMMDDKNDQFVLKKVTTYLIRHLIRYPVISQDFFMILCWALGSKIEVLSQCLLNRLSERDKDSFEEELFDCDSSYKDFAGILNRMFTRCRKRRPGNFSQKIIRLLKDQIESLKFKGLSDIEKHVNEIAKMFHLTKQETEFCKLLLIISNYEPVEDFFVHSLGCNKFSGKKYLINILNLNKVEMNHIFEGTLNKINLIEIDRFDLRLKDEFIAFFQNPSIENLSKNFFTPIPKNNIPLDYHFVQKEETDFVIRLLKNKSRIPTHILLYGPPGTGKTTFAYGLIERLGMPEYLIAQDEANITKNRRAAILACINLTNSGKGSIIVVDEADNILNTKSSWFERGENQDKGWLNQFLEEPGVRIIWITNMIDGIEDSALRRFSYSIHFPQFNRRQRIHLWRNIAEANNAKNYFDEPDILNLAEQYKASAGVIDLSVKKAIALNQNSKKEFHRNLKLVLDANYSLAHYGEKLSVNDQIEKDYTYEGLNIDCDIKQILKQIEKYDHHIRSEIKQKAGSMNLLFYGPPGSGKSELARYIGLFLNRNTACKRLSDLLNPYVGMSEKNIKSAFSQAELDELVLIIDEIESLLFPRDRAIRSWEVNLTNEFLTQMERFRGILVCSTNRIHDMDEASIRRFTFKVKFDYLIPKGNVIFFEKMIQPLLPKPITDQIKNELMVIPRLVPGDFKTVRDKFCFYSREELNHQMMIDSLINESQIKKIHSKHEAIGFLPLKKSENSKAIHLN